MARAPADEEDLNKLRATKPLSDSRPTCKGWTDMSGQAIVALIQRIWILILKHFQQGSVARFFFLQKTIKTMRRDFGVILFGNNKLILKLYSYIK